MDASYIVSFQTSDTIEGIFFSFFYITYNLVLIIFFVAIILSNFGHIRKRTSLTTEAITRISTNQSKDLTQKWLNLFFMRPPIDEEEEERERKLKPSHSEKCAFCI